jgi:hypothetical protein
MSACVARKEPQSFGATEQRRGTDSYTDVDNCVHPPSVADKEHTRIQIQVQLTWHGIQIPDLTELGKERPPATPTSGSDEWITTRIRIYMA